MRRGGSFQLKPIIFFLYDATGAHLAFLWSFRHIMRADRCLPAAVPGNAIVTDECAMIAVQLSSLVPSTPIDSAATTVREAERSVPSPSDQPATVASQFQPLDPDIFNAAIPAFFIGRNSDGFWVARDVNGQMGGIFLLENSAVSFAKRNSRPAGCATIYPSERFELDIENDGNPLVAQLAPLMRLASRPWRRTAALIGKMTAAIKRRF
jgi:hypothetical protein